MFGKKENLIGIDIGSHSVKVLELKSKRDGYTLKNAVSKELTPDVISEGAIVDYGEVVNAILDIFKENTFTHKKIASALKGNAVIAKRLTVASVDDKNFDEVFRWEAEQYIQMDIDEVNIDYEILSKNEDMEQADVLLAVARKDLIADIVSVIESAKLKPQLVDLEVFSLINSFEVAYGTDSDVTSIISVGHSSMIILFVRNGVYEFSREINYGVKDCLEMIQQELGVSGSEATALIKDSEAVQFNEELSDTLSKFNKNIGNEVKNTIDMFYTSSQMSVAKSFLCGGGSNIHGLKDSLAKQTSLEFNYFNPFTNIDLDKSIDSDYINEHMYIFNVALGLALRKTGEK